MSRCSFRARLPRSVTNSRRSFAGTLPFPFSLFFFFVSMNLVLSYFSFTDPACIKSTKVDVLILLATEQNQAAIVSELTEYVSDVDPDLARQAIRAIAKVGIRIPSAVDGSITSLLGLLELKTSMLFSASDLSLVSRLICIFVSDYVTAQVCTMLKDILRKYPDRYEEVIPALEKCLRDVDEPEVCVCVVFISLGIFVFIASLRDRASLR
jgi:vesicle coat complex subunit